MKYFIYGTCALLLCDIVVPATIQKQLSTANETNFLGTIARDGIKLLSNSLGKNEKNKADDQSQHEQQTYEKNEKYKAKSFELEREKNKLIEKIKTLEARIACLEAEKQTFSLTSSSSKTTNQLITQQNDQLQKTVQAQNGTLMENQREVNALRNQVFTVNLELDTIKGKFNQATSELERLRKEIFIYSTQKGELEASVTQLQQELNAARQQNAMLQTTSQEFQKLRAVNDEQQREIARLQSQTAEIKAENLLLRTSVEKLTVDNSRLTETNKAMSAENEMFNEETAQYKSQITSLQEGCQKMAELNTSLTRELSKYEQNKENVVKQLTDQGSNYQSADPR
jgi:chromosome segregation protein